VVTRIGQARKTEGLRRPRRVALRFLVMVWIVGLAVGGVLIVGGQASSTNHPRELRAPRRVAPATGSPTVTSVTPDCGPDAGGTSVVVVGTNLSGATAVDFGSTAASTYTVDSSTEISATSPSGSDGTVNVTVTTSSGTSATSAADDFTYAGCAYVANFGSGTISVINTALSLVTTTITLPTAANTPRPDAVALTSDNEQLYVADPANETVYVYPTSTYALESSDDLTDGVADPVKLALVTASSTTYLLAANAASSAITAYTLASDLPSSGTPSHTLTAPYVSGIGGMETVPGTANVMFVSTAANAVGKLSASSWSLSDVQSASGQFIEPDAIGYSTNNATAYVADEVADVVSGESYQIYAITVSSLSIVGAITGTSSRVDVPSALWCTSSSKCFEADAGSNAIGTISTSSSPGSMTTSPIGPTDIDGAVALASVPGTSTLYVVNDGGGSIGLFDNATDSMTGTIAVGTNPCAVVVMKS
jgi:YVTN family beta-propeller protein